MDEVKNNDVENGYFNILVVVIFSSIVFVIINILLYKLKNNINYIEISAHTLLVLISFYMIYITENKSTNKNGFYYYISVGFTFIYFGLFIIAFDQLFIYDKLLLQITTRILFVLGYSLVAIGLTKWVAYNELKHDELSIQANTDELTGILNRRSFKSFLKIEFNKAKKNSDPFSLIIIDIDYFKAINDEYGHLIGDEVLKNLTYKMNESFRSLDKLCRWGGEEFAILLPSTSLKNANTVAEKIRKIVENHTYHYKNTIIKYTISLGISESLTTDKDIESVISRADDALYQAKNNNRNCVRSVRA